MQIVNILECILGGVFVFLRGFFFVCYCCRCVRSVDVGSVTAGMYRLMMALSTKTCSDTVL
jgi:hypothetical protein